MLETIEEASDPDSGGPEPGAGQGGLFKSGMEELSLILEFVLGLYVDCGKENGNYYIYRVS